MPVGTRRIWEEVIGSRRSRKAVAELATVANIDSVHMHSGKNIIDAVKRDTSDDTTVQFTHHKSTEFERMVSTGELKVCLSDGF